MPPREISKMSIWVGKNQMYVKAKSLKDYEAKLKRTNADKSFRVQVFKSVKKLTEGLDYRNYDWDGESLRKSDVQPAVELNQIFSDWGR